MIVVGLDPGTKQTGLAIWDGSEILHHETIPNQCLLEQLRAPGSGLPVSSVVAVERLHPYGVRVGADTFQTIEFFGAVCECLRRFEIVRVYRREVKAHWLGKASGNDADIRRAMMERYGEPGKKAAPGMLYGIKPDALQALALAVAVYDQMEGDLRLSKKEIEGLRRAG